MTGVIATIPRFQFLDANAEPLVGGMMEVYLAGTTTPTPSWQDQALTILNTNPIVLDSRGYTMIWLDSRIKYKFILKNRGGALQWSQDNIVGGEYRRRSLFFDLHRRNICGGEYCCCVSRASY